MTSKYAKEVRRLLRIIYPAPQRIISEVSIGSLTKDILFSKSLKDLMKLYEARIGRMRLDFWVKYQVAIEVHGEQHEQEIKFSNDIEDTAAELERRKGLDLVKQEALKQAGIPIVIVWYYEIKDLTAEILKEKIVAAQAIAKEATPKYLKKQDDKSRIKISSLGGPRLTSSSKLSTNLGGNKRERRLLNGQPLRKPKKGESKLSRDWKQYKDRRKK